MENNYFISFYHLASQAKNHPAISSAADGGWFFNREVGFSYLKSFRLSDRLLHQLLSWTKTGMSFGLKMRRPRLPCPLQS